MVQNVPAEAQSELHSKHLKGYYRWVTQTETGWALEFDDNVSMGDFFAQLPGWVSHERLSQRVSRLQNEDRVFDQLPTGVTPETDGNNPKIIFVDIDRTLYQNWKNHQSD